LRVLEELDQIRGEKHDVNLRILVLENVGGQSKQGDDTLGERVDNTIHVSDDIFKVRHDGLNHAYILDTLHKVRELLHKNLHVETISISMACE
jgi:hypothetical protein